MELAYNGSSWGDIIKGLFTRRKGYPSKRVTLAEGEKIARDYKQHFPGRVTL